MICKFCQQGTVVKAMINKTSDVIKICDECDSVWYEECGVVKVTNFDNYMASKGLPPLWSEITISDNGYS